VNKARRRAWAHGIARHGALPPVKVADRELEGVTCIRLDATVMTAHSGKELAEPDFKGYGHHPVIAACDNVAEPLAWMLRPGSAGSNTAADHLRLLGEAITALPPALRRPTDGHLRRGRRQPRPGAGAGPARLPARLPSYPGLKSRSRNRPARTPAAAIHPSERSGLAPIPGQFADVRTAPACVHMSMGLLDQRRLRGWACVRPPGELTP